MSDLFILYSVFSYLFMIGSIKATWQEVGYNAKIDAFICLIAAPASMPLLLGTTFIK
jgi:uncharacterized protein YggT (Ycf19 family)